MFWTWDSSRAGAPARALDRSRAPQEEQPLSGYSRSVDRLFYAAVGLLALCVILLLVY